MSSSGDERQKAADEREMEMEMWEPVIVGAMVLDIHATPSLPPAPKTTIPGKVYYTLGGVARNVAECISKLGVKPFMISALGLDMPGNMLLEQWKNAGLSMRGIWRHQDISTPVVCNVFDSEGEVAAGVASVESVEMFVTPDWIHQFKCNISSAPILMVDANLSPLALETCCKLAAELKVPVWFEPVSVTKSRRIASIAKYVAVASPNEDELVAMANALSGREVFHPVKNAGHKTSVETLFQMLKPAIWVLLESGIQIVVVTIGPEGVILCSKGNPNTVLCLSKQYGSCGKLYKLVESTCPFDRHFEDSKFARSSHLFSMHFPSLPAKVVRLTGAGDCLVGGTLASLSAGLDFTQSLAIGIAAAKATVESGTNVPSTFDLASLADDARSVYAAAKFLFHRSLL